MGRKTMIDVTRDDCLTLVQAAKLLPPGRGGRKVHLSTLLRWIRDGATSPDGRRIRLEGCRLGDRWIISREAIARFVAALTPEMDHAEPAPAPRTPGQRTRSAERAAAKLATIGI
jgi:hypothetical protein